MRAALTLMLICSVAFAADDETAKLPYVERGDCWSYRAENMFHQKKPLLDYELCVTLVDKAKGTILAVAKVKEDEREIDTVFSSEWATYAGVSGFISSQGARILRFPLKSGDTYATEYEFRDSRLGPNEGKVAMHIRVLDWEDVTVPAGIFRALKVEGKGKAWRYDRNVEFEQSSTWWYSPKVGRHVKFRYQNPSRSYGEELTGYRLNQ